MWAARALMVLVVSAALLASAAPATSAVPLTNDHIIFWVDGLTARDFLRCKEASAYCRMGREGSLALLSTRTEHTGEDPAAASASAGATLAAGARREATSADSDVVPPADSPFAGMPLIRVTRPGVAPAPGPVLATRGADGRNRVIEIPEGNPRRVLAAAERALRDREAVMVDLTTQSMNSARVGLDVRYPIVDDTYFDAAATIAEAMRVRRHLVWVVSAVPTLDRLEAGVRLGVIARCCGYPSLMDSGTTKTKGVVSLIDVAPTFARISRPDSYTMAGAEGRFITVSPVRYPADRLDRLESEIVHAAVARFPLTRRALLLAMVSVALAAFIVVRGLGRARGDPLPRGVRAWSSVSLLAAAAVPVWIYVEGALPVSGVLSASLLVGGAALVTALLGRARLGSVRALLWVCAAGVIIPVVDLFLGTPLAYRSPWAFQIAGGGRFYGVDEGVLGLALGAHLVAAGYALDQARKPRRAFLFAVASFVIVAWALGAPGLGAKFGAPLTAVPAFGVLALRAAGRRIGVTAIIGILAATIGITGAMVAVDRWQAPQSESHIARATEGETNIAALVARKMQAQLRITFTTVWSSAALVFAGALLLIRMRRRDAWDRGLWGRPGSRAAVTACVVGSICGLLFNDGGVVAAAPILLYAAAGVLVPLVEPQQ